MYKTAQAIRRRRDGKHRGSSQDRAQLAPGAGPPPPLDALQPDGRRTTDAEIPIITRGEGCYVYDEHGKRYLDGLSALFCVNIGHGRADVAQAGADQAKELGFYTNWTFAHPRSIELAARVAELAPGDLNRVFFTSGGSEAVESAIKLARQYHKITGNPLKTKIVARDIAYHGTSLGALSATGITSLRQPFEPLMPGGVHVPNTNTFRLPHGLSADDLADTVAAKIEFEGPDTVAAVIMEPVQNAGGCFTPPEGYWKRVREICDKYNVLLISDEVICAWGRLGEWFGAQRYDYLPDLITTAKGLTSAYAPMGAVIASDRVAEPFMQGDASFTHGFTFAGHPICSAVALANLDVMEREGILENVRHNEGPFRDMLESLRDIPIVGDIRGAGYFNAIELVKDQDSDEQWTDEESETLLRGFLSGELYRRGLICRADDRGDPVIQLSPPLIAGPAQFEEIEAILRPVLTEAGDRMRGDPRASAQSAGHGNPRPPGRVGRDRSVHGQAELMLTVRELLRELDVRLLCGEAATDLPVRWVHISELKDPTPWLSGGELLLTTGMQLNTPQRQREFVNRLADHRLAGVGFGVGFGHREVPEALVEAAVEREFPVFEVPYELPFIAVTETAFTQLVNEQYAVLRRALAAHERLERVVLSERGLDALAGTLATLIGAAVVVFDARGEPLVQRAFRRALEPEAVAALATELYSRRSRTSPPRAFLPS